MNTNKAQKHLQFIRGVMERSALYRRALAGIYIFIALAGLSAGGLGFFRGPTDSTAFLAYWMGLAVLIVLLATGFMGFQALRAGEPFWQGPVPRIAHHLFPPLFCGAVLGGACLLRNDAGDLFWLIPLWMTFYGLGLIAVSAIVPKGLLGLGWAFILAGLTVFSLLHVIGEIDLPKLHLIMGATFGAGHLLHGCYLCFAESRRDDS